MSSALDILTEFREASDEVALMSTIIAMPREAVPALAVRITEARRLLDRLEKTAEAVMESHGLKQWTAPDGKQWTFDGTHKRVVSDIAGLRAALFEACVEVGKTDPLGADADARIIEKRCFKTKEEPAMSVINELAERDDRYREARDEWVSWQSGPRHLKLVDPQPA